MWLLDTTSCRGQDEYQDSDIWYDLTTGGKRNQPLIHPFVEGTTVYDALEKGLEDLKDLCDVVLEKFVAARDEFNQGHRR